MCIGGWKGQVPEINTQPHFLAGVSPLQSAFGEEETWSSIQEKGQKGVERKMKGRRK